MNRARHLPDAAATEQFGRTLARELVPPLVIYLRGDLGAGKTTLVRGLLRGLGVTGACKSPTYTLVEPYEVAGMQVFHFDLYRLQSPEELDFVGLRDYVDQEAICLFEWPDRAPGMLPVADLTLWLEPRDGGRELSVGAHTAAGTDLLRRLQGAGRDAGA